MKKIILGVFLSVLVFSIIASVSAVNDTNNSTGCKNLYWFDNDNKSCGQKEFCGTYMYLGLQTFESKTQCEKAVNETKKELNKTYCEKDEDCACIGGKINIAANPERICKVGNKKNIGTEEEICEDKYCLKLAEYKEIKCVENKCKIINKFCDEETSEGICYKTLSNGRKAEIKIMPETASEKAIERLGELGFTIELKEVGNNTKDTSDDGVVYELTGNKEGKFLGIFKIMASEKVQVDAETGEVKKVIKPWWSFLASGI